MIDIFSPRTMLQVVETMYPAKTFLRDTFFKEIETFDTEKVDMDIVKGKRRLAPFVHPKMPGTVMSRDGFQTNTYKPPLIAPKTVTTAEQILKRSPGETLYGSSRTAVDRAAEMMAKDLAQMDEAITRREEWMASQVMFTGKIPIKGKGVNEIIDFSHTQKITLAGEARWGNANSDPLADLKKWRKTCIQTSGITPDICILSSDVAETLFKHEKVQKMLDNRRIVMGQIEPRQLPNSVTYYGQLGGEVCLDVYTYDEWYLSDEDQKEYPMVPEGKVLIASSRAGFVRAYGAYVDIGENGMFTINSVPRYPRSFVDQDPPVRYLQMCSLPLLIPKRPDSYFIADVL